MRCSLVIPCYNESRNLGPLLERCDALAARPDIEVVIVDNGSTDDTQAVLPGLLAGRAHCRSVSVPVNQGYGHGILAGARAARGEIVGWTHADLQTDPLDVLDGLALFEAHGERLLAKGRRHGRPWVDRFFTAGMGVFETLLLRQPMWDINAQPTLMPRAFLDELKNPPQDFSLDLYVIYTARALGLPVRRFPVRVKERLFGVSHWNVGWTSRVRFIRRTVDFSLELRRRLRAGP